MSRRDRRRVLVGLAVLVVVLMIAGAGAAWYSRNDTICSDGRPPVAQRAIGLGQIEYRCHDGQLVTK
jgi:uncharacterized membrane protein